MKIIAVDDDTVSLDLLDECLTQGGYENVELETSPSAALEKISNASDSYDCILLDIDMPQMDGIQLCAEIRKFDHHKNTPILMITRYNHRGAVQKAFEMGATDYVTKPFEFLEVLTRIKVAERLVQERQAALDSYMAINNIEAGRHETAPAAEHRRADRSDSILSGEEIKMVDDAVLSPAIFQNYLEQMSKSSSCDLNLVAIQIKRIDRIFSRTSAAEFTGFLHSVAKAVVHQFRPHSVFLTQAGNGVLLVALDGAAPIQPEEVEAKVIRTLQTKKMPKALHGELALELIVGAPLHLPTSPKLNFKRAVKAATARMKQREQEREDFNLSALSM